MGELTFPPVAAAVNPGGSGILVVFFATGGELRSRTHCGGGGEGPAISSLSQVAGSMRPSVREDGGCWIIVA